jgi:hypothetical protein
VVDVRTGSQHNPSHAVASRTGDESMYTEAEMVRARDVKPAESARRIRTKALVAQVDSTIDRVIAAVKETGR